MAKRIRLMADKDKRGFTILELIIVVVLVGILASMGTISFSASKEKAMDKEAISNLKLIQAAEQAYFIDNYSSVILEGGCTYYPCAGTVSDIAAINENLQLSLPTGSKRNWNYTISFSGCITATRNGDDGRSWYLNAADSSDNTPVSTGC